jgi:hypothetical protein
MNESNGKTCSDSAQRQGCLEEEGYQYEADTMRERGGEWWGGGG